MSVLRLLEQKVRSTPESNAVVCGQVRLTYRDLDDRSNQIAYALQQAGVKAETPVGVFLEHSVDAVAVILAIWKAGGAYVPLDSEYPRDRLSYMLEDSGASFLLTNINAAEVFPETAAKIISFESIFAQVPAPLVNHFYEESARDQLAYIIYTSGSTGKPKGAELTHSGLVNVLQALREELMLGPADVVLASASVSFDVSILELLLPIISGATVHVIDRGVVVDPHRFMECIDSLGATLVLGTPTSWRILLEAGWKGNPKLQIITGGEVLPASLVDAMTQKCRALWNHYGPTETTICTTTELVTSGMDKITIGRPLANAQIHILDDNLQSLPAGEIGEMYIGGAGVGRGYRNRPDLTEKCFLPNIFDPRPGARIYKTGDRARLLPDGRVEFMGRVDDQVKIRGFRIELEEIEEVIRQCEGVQNAAVTAIEFGPGDKRLVAYFTGTAQLSQEQIKDFLRDRLPSYMVPSEFVSVGSLPSTPSGKVNRQALKELRPKSPNQVRNVQSPDDEIEYKLVRIWESILRVRPIGITDNFFDLGGHSLLAARMFATIEKKLGISMPLSMLVENATIERLALRIRQQLPGREWPGLIAIQPLGSKPPLFVVHGFGGSLFSFRPLAEVLGADQPVYGLQRGADSPERPTIKALAARYVNEIQTVDPIGPYNIAGHSSGGMIAFEVASQLVALGKEVNVLALLNCDYRFGKRSSKASDSRIRLVNPLHVLKQNYKHAVRQASEIGWNALFWRRYFHEIIKFKFWLLKHSPWKQKYFPTLFGVEAYLALSAEKYKPRPYPGDVMLFIAEDAAKPNDDFGAGWAKSILGKLEILKVPGGHQSMLTQPKVVILANELIERLERRASTEEVVLGL